MTPFAVDVQNAADIVTALENMASDSLAGAVGIVDLSGTNGRRFRSRRRPANPLHALELPLRYPEVYWVFLLDRLQVNEPGTRAQPSLAARSHFVGFDDLPRIAELLTRHANGFRTLFDPTGLRVKCRNRARNLADLGGSHSAPHLIQSIASSLVSRASRISAQAREPLDAIHGAVLALDAWMMLRGATPTLALHAMQTLHVLESIAECSFVGQSGVFEVKDRLRELERNIEHLFDQLSVPRREAAEQLPPLAIAIDEETDHVNFNAYVLYRAGYRALAVDTYESMKVVLGFRGLDHEKRPKRSPERNPLDSALSIVLEDIELRFARIPEEERHCLLPERRHEYFPALASETVSRVCVTSGEINHGPYWRARLPKPYSGVHDRRLIDALRPSGTVQASRVALTSAIRELPPGLRWTDSWRFTRRIVRWFSRKEQGLTPDNRRNLAFQETSALVSISEELQQVYRKYGQFDEEEQTLHRVRNYRLWLSILDGQALRTGVAPSFVVRRLARYFAFPLLAYLNTALKSPARILGLVLFWILAFAMVRRVGPHATESLASSIAVSGLTFLEMQSPGEFGAGCSGHRSCLFFLFAELAAAYMHLALLVAVMYQRFSRR